MKNNKLLIILLIIIIALLVFLQNAGDTKESDAKTDASIESSGDETQILLYFLDDAGTKLVPEYRYVLLEQIKENMLETMMLELLKRT